MRKTSRPNAHSVEQTNPAAAQAQPTPATPQAGVEAASQIPAEHAAHSFGQIDPRATQRAPVGVSRLDDKLNDTPTPPSQSRVTPPLSQAIRRASGNAPGLPSEVRSSMEQSFGGDLGDVKVHADTQADSLNRALSARAFTVGRHVFFRQGAYQPTTPKGKSLLAHELTHVRQQGASDQLPSTPLPLSQPGDTVEREAEQVAGQVMAGQPATVSGQAGVGVHRALLDDVVMGAKNTFHDLAETVGIESPEEAEDGRLQAFLNHGLFGPQSLVPPTNIGGFDASYDPSDGMLLIEVRTGIEFLHGLKIDKAGVITANHTKLTQAARDGMALPVAERAAFVEQFTWQSDQEDTFVSDLQESVEEAWSSSTTDLSFVNTRPGWDSVTAAVVVDVDVHKGAAAGSDHLQTTVYKVPEGGKYSVGAFVDSDRNDPNVAHDQDPFNNQLVMSSNHVKPTPEQRSLLRKKVLFANDSAVLSGEAKKTLNAFAKDFRDANLDLTNPVELVGHASSTGTAEHNQKLAQARIDAVRKHLQNAGFTGIDDRVSTNNEGEEGATEDAEWRRVDLIVGSGEGQLVASHEFGHVFGLDDEYVSKDKNPGGSIRGSGHAVGEVVGHDEMAKAIGTDGAVGENNDSIMSLGNTVRPQHYATFGWALAQVTGIEEWQVV